MDQYGYMFGGSEDPAYMTENYPDTEPKQWGEMTGVEKAVAIVAPPVLGAGLGLVTSLATGTILGVSILALGLGERDNIVKYATAATVISGLVPTIGLPVFWYYSLAQGK